MIRKFGAPASSHERRITAEDVELTQGCPLTKELEEEKKNDKEKDDKKAE